MEQAINHFIASNWWQVLTSAVTVASVVAAATPNRTDNAVLKIVRVVVDALALNFGGASNAPVPAPPKATRLNGNEE